MWRALKAPRRGYPAETYTPGVRPAITRDYSGLKQFNPSRAISCQLIQGIVHPFGEENGAGQNLVDLPGKLTYSPTDRMDRVHAVKPGSLI